MRTLSEKVNGIVIPVLCFILVAAPLIYYVLGNVPTNACGVYCVEDKELIISENADVHIAPASLTKLLTACTALSIMAPDMVLTVGSEQDLVPKHSSLCLILEGHVLKLRDLIAGMLMVSGNDAAYTVAAATVRESVTSAISNEECIERFCGLMNDFALSIGMTDSNFLTPDGSDTPDQYTTVSDLIKLAEYALTVPTIKEIISQHERYTLFESGENITWTNSNKLIDPESLYYSPYASGMKTGTTVKAGNCLIGVFEKNGKTYISVVSGCSTDGQRYEITLMLMRDIL